MFQCLSCEPTEGYTTRRKSKQLWICARWHSLFALDRAVRDSLRSCPALLSGFSLETNPANDSELFIKDLADMSMFLIYKGTEPTNRHTDNVSVPSRYPVRIPDNTVSPSVKYR
jgi:hypothetical protein